MKKLRLREGKRRAGGDTIYSFIHAVIYLVIKYLLNCYYVLDAGDTMISKGDVVPAFMELTV